MDNPQRLNGLSYRWNVGRRKHGIGIQRRIGRISCSTYFLESFSLILLWVFETRHPFF